jgi:hypothetical protein
MTSASIMPFIANPLQLFKRNGWNDERLEDL